MASESSRPKPIPTERRAPLSARASRDPFVDSEQVDAAWKIVREHLHRTPTVRVPLAAGHVSSECEVFAKLETRQIMGSFKTRGAFARLSRPDARRGVVTSSAGNHGLGVGFAGRMLDIRTTVVVPPTCPEIKRFRLEELAKLIVAPNQGYDEAERYARALAASHSVPFVSPFDDPWVAAGNGATLAREILEDVPGCDAIIVPVGGGGLVSGIGRYLEIVGADVDVIGVQSERTNAMAVSMLQGHAVVSMNPVETLAEGLEGGVAPRTYTVAKRVIREMVLVKEDDIGRAMAMVFQEMGEVLEGSGAVVVAAMLAGRIPRRYRRPCLVFTGRNVDRTVLDEQLEKHLGPKRRIN